MSIPIHRFIDPVDEDSPSGGSISTVDTNSPTENYGRWSIKNRDNFVAMRFPGVVPEHVPGTLGGHGMFPVPCSLFPVPLRIPPPPKKNLQLTPQKLTSGGPAPRLASLD